MGIFGQSMVYRDESDGRVHFGLLLAKGTKVAVFTEEAIPAFCANAGIDHIMVDIRIDPVIPGSLLN